MISSNVVTFRSLLSLCLQILPRPFPLPGEYVRSLLLASVAADVSFFKKVCQLIIGLVVNRVSFGTLAFVSVLFGHPFCIDQLKPGLCFSTPERLLRPLRRCFFDRVRHFLRILAKPLRQFLRKFTNLYTHYLFPTLCPAYTSILSFVFGPYVRYTVKRSEPYKTTS